MNKNQITLIITGFILLALMATNPSLEEHKVNVKSMFIKQMEKNSKRKNLEKAKDLAASIGSSIADRFIDQMVSRKNYYLFSTTQYSIKDETKIIGFGILGQVFIQDYEKIQSEIGGDGLVNESETIESNKKTDIPEIQREVIVLDGLEVMKNDLEGDLYLLDAQKIADSKGDGWRVPTLNELKKLYNNRSAIGGLQWDARYISSDEHSSDGTYREIKILDFRNGEIGWDFYCCKGPGGKVRLVRYPTAQ